jgi:aldose 1-epimerase
MIRQRPFGTLPAGHPDAGSEVVEYTLDNGAGLTLSAINLGGIVTALHAPDRQGRRANVVLGLPTLEDYVRRNPNFGTLVGRYANRIAGARFVLDGRTVELPANHNGRNCLHGGVFGFGKRWWKIEPELQPDPAGAHGDSGVALKLLLTSPDGDEGFPGRLEVTVRYELTPANEWRVSYRASTDAPTVINLSQHAYFNLAGAGSALGQKLTLHASRFIAVDEHVIPTDVRDVTGTPFDFRAGVRIDERIRSGDEQLALARGYDHNWILDRAGSGLVRAARLHDEPSGRVLEVETTEPAVQFYSGNFLDGSQRGSGGALYRQGDGICLETQHYPDSPNRADFPGTVLRPGEVFESLTVFRFGVAR